MSIYTQACGVVLLLVLFVLFAMKRSKIFLDTEKYFVMTLKASLTANALDILCQYVLWKDGMDSIVLGIVCRLYQISLVATLCFTMLYVSRDIYTDIKRFVIRSWYYVALFVVVSILVGILPQDLIMSEGKMYAAGVAVNVTYLSCMFFFGAVLVRVNVLRKSMNADRRWAINFWMVIWILAAVIEYLMPTLFVTSFASAIGVMIVYVKLENPAMNRDRRSNLYNQNALMEYMNQLYGKGLSFAVIEMVPLTYGDGVHNHTVDFKRLPELFDVGKNPIFRKTEDEIALVFENYEKAKEWGDKFIARTWEIDDLDMRSLKNSIWISIPNSSWFVDTDEMMYFLKYVVSIKQINLELRERKYILVTEEMVKGMREEKRIEKMLDDALREHRIEVFYQPIFSTEKRRFTTAEALVRLRDDEGNIVSPGLFIEIAEKTGKILELGTEVFRQVCSFIKEENITQYGIDYVEVNLSVAQCADSQLADSYINTMKEFEIDPKCINLEITESASMKSKEVLLDNMKRLIEYGVNFSLDDFGTGQSNLNYIVDMPVDIVKFDKGMIDAYFDNNKAKYVMDAAMHMIHGMGLKIVSEGIETNEQYDRMEDLGISYIQGYYFSKPLEKKEFLEYIKKHNQGATDVH